METATPDRWTTAANSACATPSRLIIDVTIGDGRADLDGGEIAVLVDQKVDLEP
jgi:hypothetical protein